MDFTYFINRFRKPLVYIVCFTNIIITFGIGHSFLGQGIEADYKWALGKLQAILQINSIPESRVIFTDRELALANAIEQKFPNSKNIICGWRIQTALESYLCKELNTIAVKDFSEDFMRVWNPSTTNEFIEQWSSCSAK